MKKWCLLLLLMIGFALPAAAQSITGTFLGSLGTMPGSTADYAFFDSTTNLTNFTQTSVGTGVTAYGVGPGAGVSAIDSPTGALVNTGIYFQVAHNSTNFELVSFTLENAGGSTFNYGDFNVYFMFGNGPNSSEINDASVGLILKNSSGGVITSDLEPVTDNNTSFSMATFEEFHVTGASAGDILEFEAAPTRNFQNYIGGVSFESNAVPEPTTWAMLLGSVAMLGLLIRFRRQRA